MHAAQARAELFRCNALSYKCQSGLLKAIHLVGRAISQGDAYPARTRLHNGKDPVSPGLAFNANL